MRPSDLASPARRALRESRRRPSGRFIAFLGKVSSRFHGLFRLSFCVFTVERDRSHSPTIFTACRRRFFFFFLGRSRLARLVVGTRDGIFSQLLTLLSPRLGSHISPCPPPPSRSSSSFLPSSFLRCFLPSCRLRYKECLFTTSLFVEPSFFTTPVALNRINLRARFKKILSHNSVMRTRPWLISYLWFIRWKTDVQHIPISILVSCVKNYFLHLIKILP